MTKEEYEKDLESLRSCIKMKGAIMSDDNGKTWFVYRQDYVGHAKDRYKKFQFSEVNLQGLPLQTDFEYLEQQNE